MIGVFGTYVYLHIDQSVKEFLCCFLFPFSFHSVNFDEQKMGEALEPPPSFSYKSDPLPHLLRSAGDVTHHVKPTPSSMFAAVLNNF